MKRARLVSTCAVAVALATPQGTWASSVQSAATRDTARRAVHGRVVTDGLGAPVPYAWVEILSDPTARGTVADPEGHYRLAGVPAGEMRVRAQALGHAPLELWVRVPESGDLSLDLSLRPLPIGLPALSIVSQPMPPESSRGLAARGSSADPELRALEATPGAAELGIAAAQTGRRGQPPPDASSILFVRGAASDLKLVLLDGAPVYAPFHLGGLLPAAHPGALDSARLYVGGAPARYDGGLSYILDLTMRSGRRDRPHAAGALDGLGARARVEAPLGPGAVLAGARVLHGWGAEGWTPDPLPYGYGEGHARLDLDFGAETHLAATAFANRESVRLDGAGVTGTADWGNVAGSVRLRARLGATHADLTAALSEFSTELPMGNDPVRVGVGRSRRLRLAAHLERKAGTTLVGYGAALERHDLALRTFGTALTDTATFAHRVDADVWSAYGDVTWPGLADLELRAGLRASGFPATDDLRLAPRVSAAWTASEHSTVSVAAGRYHQYVRTAETILSGDLEAGWQLVGPERTQASDSTANPLGTSGSGPPLAVAAATHWVVRLDHAPREELRLGLEGFYKTYDVGVEASDLRAAGADLWFDWQDGPWAAWAGYSLAWVWSVRVPADTADPDATRFAGRQLLSAGLRAPLPAGARLDVHLATSAGLPYSAVPIGSTGTIAGDGVHESSDPRSDAPELAGAPDGSYLRLDAEVSRVWEARLFGAPGRFRPYVRLLNALDRRDALFYQFDAGRDLHPRSLGAVPLLPIAGIEWSL